MLKKTGCKIPSKHSVKHQLSSQKEFTEFNMSLHMNLYEFRYCAAIISTKRHFSRHLSRFIDLLPSFNYSGATFAI